MHRERGQDKGGAYGVGYVKGFIANCVEATRNTQLSVTSGDRRTCACGRCVHKGGAQVQGRLRICCKLCGSEEERTAECHIRAHPPFPIQASGRPSFFPCFFPYFFWATLRLTSCMGLGNSVGRFLSFFLSSFLTPHLGRLPNPCLRTYPGRTSSFFLSFSLSDSLSNSHLGGLPNQCLQGVPLLPFFLTPTPHLQAAGAVAGKVGAEAKRKADQHVEQRACKGL